MLLRWVGSCLLLAVLSSLLAADLPEKYRKWLEEVIYIITPREKEVFLKLKSDRERDLFIENFWKQRDPTPGTERNEFREEHYRRLNYANQYFGRGTGKPGWKTDQGRIYIILGPPNNIEKFEDIMGVYPTQVWFYYGDPALGLPAGFNIIFFKKEGTGEYIIYSPSDHGPQALVADYMYNAADARDAYQRLYRLAPNLAEHSLSLIPNERMEPGVINLSSNKLLATIFSLPQRRVEDSYAEAWFKYKDIIEVEYSTNYIRADFEVWAYPDGSGSYLVNYSFEPAKVSVQPASEGYLIQFDLNGRISDDQGRTVYQFEKTIPVKLTPDQLSDLGQRTVAVQDVFPLIPGQYTFDLLVKNPLSKEFSSCSAKLVFPGPSEASRLGDPVLAFDSRKVDNASVFKPFQAAGWEFFVQARKSFVPVETLVLGMPLSGLTRASDANLSFRLNLLHEDQSVLQQYLDQKNIYENSFIYYSLPLKAYAPGYYSLKLELLEKGQLREVRKVDFEISALKALPRPLIITRGQLERADCLLLTGLQSLTLGQIEEALKRIKQAYEVRPDERATIAYASVLFRLADYQKVIELLSPLAGERAPAEVFALLGQAHHALNDFARAAVFYETYLERFGTSLDILNFLGTCYYQLGQKDRALNVWEKSLSLKPDQEKLKELVNSLKKK
ncbi:MAG: GWxTD domain-containing protein [Candidatus Aminicenantes bacterium]|nr:GWxTD domain-containing protein [Candidatus Aminicenantes bacterium]